MGEPTEKMCGDCHKVLSLDAFYNDKYHRYGKSRRCKGCDKIAVARCRENERGKIGNRMRQSRYRSKYPEKQLAHRIARKVHGPSKEGECGVCGQVAKLEKHHPDYSMPTVVIAICKSCHVERHTS